MKKTSIILLLTLCVGMAHAQNDPQVSVGTMSFDTVGADTARAVAVIERYMKKIDFGQSKSDSVLSVVTYVVDRDYPNDTMTIYRWYKPPYYNRIEIWQSGKMEDGYHSDGLKLFRKFHTGRREWATLTPDSYYQTVLPLDIRGALYNWRSKGAEVFYAGEMTYEGSKLDRVFVCMPEVFDRYYFFEQSTGLLGLVVEENHIFGDREPAKNAVRIDWHAWHEFVPFNGYYLPREESYQVDNSQIVILSHTYRYIAPDTKIFTEDYYRHK